MPSNKEWGPPLWRVLHGLAENLGKVLPPLMAADEAREMYFILKFVDTVMPCALCQSHYRAWKKQRNIEGVPALRREDLQEFVKRWLYDLHENVNTTHEVAYESLPELYKDTDVRSAFREFQEGIRTSVGTLTVGQEDMKKFIRHFEALRRIIGK